jgi:hypothetical protein
MDAPRTSQEAVSEAMQRLTQLGTGLIGKVDMKTLGTIMEGIGEISCLIQAVGILARQEGFDQVMGTVHAGAQRIIAPQKEL